MVTGSAQARPGQSVVNENPCDLPKVMTMRATRALSRARTWTAGALAAAALTTGVAGYHLATAQDTSTVAASSTSSASTPTTSGTTSGGTSSSSSSTSGFSSSGTVSSSSGAAQSPTQGS